MTGDERIRAAAREAGAKVKDDGAGDRKIRAAAQECADPNALGLVAKVRRYMEAVGQAPPDSEADRRIRRNAGLPVDDEDDVLTKALESAVAALNRPQERLLPEAKLRQEAMPAAKPRPRPLKFLPPRQEPSRPAPGRTAPAPPPVTLPPRPINPDSHLGFWDFRDRLAGDIRAKVVVPSPEAIVGHATAKYGVGVADAADWTERFLASLSRDMERRARP